MTRVLLQPPSRVVVRDLSLVVTVDAEDTVLRDATIVVEDGVITQVGTDVVPGSSGDTLQAVFNIQ